MALPATDNFNRDDANPIGGNWTTITGVGDIQLSGNACAGTSASSDNAAYWNADSFANDQYAQIKKLTTSNDHGPLVRGATNNCYIADTYSTAVDIWKNVAGSWSQVGSSISITLSANDVIKLTVTTTTLEVFQNGISRGTRTDSALASGSAGMWAYQNSTSHEMDDWEGGNVSSDLFKVISESMNTSEARTSLLVLRKIQTETMQIAESILRLFSLRRILTESIQMVEIATRPMVILRFASDSMPISDIALRGFGMPRFVNESMQAAETAVRQIIFIRVLNEVSQVVETVISGRLLLRAVNETLQIADSVIDMIQRMLYKLIADGVSITESISTTISGVIYKIVAEMMYLLEGSTDGTGDAVMGDVILGDEGSSTTGSGILKILDMHRFANETIQAIESLLNLVTVTSLYKIITESIQIGEAVVRGIIMPRFIVESIQASEVAGRHMIMLRVINESIQLADSALSLLQRMLYKILSEVVQTTEATAYILYLRQFLTEVVQVAEGIFTPIVFRRVLAETMQMAEYILVREIFLRYVNEIVQIADGVYKTALQFSFRVITESMQVAETIYYGFDFRKIIVEIAQINEALNLKRIYIRIMNEAVQIVENVLAARVMYQMLVETMQILEGVPFINAFFKVVNESITIAESFVSRVVLTIIVSLLKARRRIFYFLRGDRT